MPRNKPHNVGGESHNSIECSDTSCCARERVEERQRDRDGDNSIRDKMPASMCADKQQMPGRQSIAAAAATAAGCGSREGTRKEAEKAQGSGAACSPTTNCVSKPQQRSSKANYGCERQPDCSASGCNNNKRSNNNSHTHNTLVLGFLSGKPRTHNSQT